MNASPTSGFAPVEVLSGLNQNKKEDEKMRYNWINLLLQNMPVSSSKTPEYGSAQLGSDDLILYNKGDASDVRVINGRSKDKDKEKDANIQTTSVDGVGYYWNTKDRNARPIPFTAKTLDDPNFDEKSRQAIKDELPILKNQQNQSVLQFHNLFPGKTRIVHDALNDETTLQWADDSKALQPLYEAMRDVSLAQQYRNKSLNVITPTTTPVTELKKLYTDLSEVPVSFKTDDAVSLARPIVVFETEAINEELTRVGSALSLNDATVLFNSSLADALVADVRKYATSLDDNVDKAQAVKTLLANRYVTLIGLDKTSKGTNYKHQRRLLDNAFLNLVIRQAGIL